MKKALLTIFALVALSSCANAQFRLDVATFVNPANYRDNGIGAGVGFFANYEHWGFQLGLSVYKCEFSGSGIDDTLLMSGYLGATYRLSRRFGLYANIDEYIGVGGLGMDLGAFYYLFPVIRISVYANSFYRHGFVVTTGLILSYEFNQKNEKRRKL